MSEEAVDVAALAGRLRAQTEINDPFTGAANPAQVQAQSVLWPDAARWPRIRLMAVTEEGERRLEEYRFTRAAGLGGLPPTIGDELPVAIMFDRGAGGPRARIYSAHELVPTRPPVLPAVDKLDTSRGPDDIMTRYFPTLHSADLEATLDLFEDDGYLQHSNGETYRGRERLRVDFTKFYQTGGIKLRYCNRTDAGARTAFECYMPSGRPAVAVYERGRTGKVGAVRIYL